MQDVPTPLGARSFRPTPVPRRSSSQSTSQEYVMDPKLQARFAKQREWEKEVDAK
jgi:hypothetical protein